ncbi:hypothetical protein [Fluviispira multicolorata]|uniref:Uncharacterized protein n=1 Tax=Fluviispira multicolorata TaxID=2654512 RepID=A0A833N0K7_9BACT|nr:hypothetical protein [Fluviispira multicolorata]KAB8029031.1 hypothetical protein GCL57_10845 [Fluviispira multicolorata]
MQSEWFKLCTPSEAAGISAAELIYSQIILGIFEVIYSIIPSDNIVRAVFLVSACILIFFYPLYRRSQLNKFIEN